MPREKITVTFDDQGNPQVHVEGHKGRGCDALTKPLEEALGVVTEKKHTAEYAQAPAAGQRVQQGGGR